jgi:HD superfamily phosphohydrolase YqeK
LRGGGALLRPASHPTAAPASAPRSRHTTAAMHMDPLDMVLYIADAIEPSRQFGRVDELRAAVDEVSLEELYYRTYEYWVFLLFERRKALHPDTIRIWNANVSQLKRYARRNEKQ